MKHEFRWVVFWSSTEYEQFHFFEYAARFADRLAKRCGKSRVHEGFSGPVVYRGQPELAEW